MSKSTYLYFNVRARGELPRLVAAAGGVSIEEKRLGQEDWPEYKPKTPFGQVPCAIVDGKWYGQKLALALYFARQGGLYPSGGNALADLQLDSALQYTEEILENMIKGFADRKFNNKPETIEAVKKETLPQKLPKLEAIVKANGTGYVAGNKLTIADMSAFDVLEHVVDLCGKAYLDQYPSLKALFEKVSQIPGVKSYIASRPPHAEGFDF